MVNFSTTATILPIHVPGSEVKGTPTQRRPYLDQRINEVIVIKLLALLQRHQHQRLPARLVAGVDVGAGADEVDRNLFGRIGRIEQRRT